MPANFSVSMGLKNIGPHSGIKEISFSAEVNSNKTIFFAPNGTGKSFISRAFRICEQLDQARSCDEILTIGKQEGIFTFDISANSIHKKLVLSINRGKVPVVNNASGYLFHVFNSDYVDDNIKPNHYISNGNFDGYILGKIQIDLTKEKELAVNLAKEIEEDSKIIDKDISEAKLFLMKNGVTANTIEFNKITRENIEHGFEYNINYTLEDCVRSIRNFEHIPENLTDIEFPPLLLDLSFLEPLKNILTTTYPASEWDAEFVKEYAKHQKFIEIGLNYDHADTICPFCKQKYSNEALELIQKYNAYKNDKESQVLRRLQNILLSIRGLFVSLENEENKIFRAEAQLNEVKKHFPSLSSYSLIKITSSKEYKDIIDSLHRKTLYKISNLCNKIDDIECTINNLVQSWNAVKNIHKANRDIIDIVNKTKNDTRAERLLLRRNLCKSQSIKLYNDLYNKFMLLNEKKVRLEKIKKDIAEKEQKAKISKKEKVFETLGNSLDRFFKKNMNLIKKLFRLNFLEMQLEIV